MHVLLTIFQIVEIAINGTIMTTIIPYLCKNGNLICLLRFFQCTCYGKCKPGRCHLQRQESRCFRTVDRITSSPSCPVRKCKYSHCCPVCAGIFENKDCYLWLLCANVINYCCPVCKYCIRRTYNKITAQSLTITIIDHPRQPSPSSKLFT